MRRARLPEKYYRKILAMVFRALRYGNRTVKIQREYIERLEHDIAAMGLTPQLLRGSRDECARAILGKNPPQQLWQPPVLRKGPQPCTDAQLTAVAEHYAGTMRALGFDVPAANLPVLKRAAAIQDAWRLAFESVLGK